jgi:thermostable 8-oxoguanine DNA glycosylase
MAACRLRDDDEVIPGVAWGRAEWVPSPAFWRALADQQPDADDYVSPPDTPLKEVVVFCLLGGYGVTAELNQAAFDHVVGHGLFNGALSSVGELRDVLNEEMALGDRRVRYRYPNQRSERVWRALEAIECLDVLSDNGRELRAQLLRIGGVGPKTGSWIARNWRGFDDVAILDIHVVRACQIMGVFPASVSLSREYYSLEDRFLAFAEGIGVRTSLLDALIWREMRLLSFLRPEV